MKRLSVRFLVGVAVLLCCSAPRLVRAADEAAEVYPTNAMGLPGVSAESYVDMFPGNDMLPYTDDDVDLTAGGNTGGNPFGLWGAAHFDTNSDNKVDPGEHIFNVGETSWLYSAASRPEYGVIYEAEDWYGAFEANGTGPTGSPPDEDFELNDNNGWCGESNAYAYNNLGGNQHGNGHSKYYFNYSTVPGPGESYVYDEISGFEKTFAFRNTNDDPATPFNEKGNCRCFEINKTGGKIELQGYLIPVDDLAGLVDGSLPTLFGWEVDRGGVLGDTIDLAKYLRETIAPLVVTSHPDLTNVSGDAGNLGPPTHIGLVQLSLPFDVTNANGECGNGNDPVCAAEADPNLCQEQQHAEYWGVTPAGGVSTYRDSKIVGFSDTFADNAFAGAVHHWQNLPDDSSQRNLWLQDHYWRDDTGHLGKYTFEGDPLTTWTIIKQPEATQADYDNTNDFVMLSSGAGAASAPLPKPLGLAEEPVEVVVDLSEDVTLPILPAAGAGGGVGPPIAFQIILRNGDSVVAYADISAAATAVHTGGTYSSATGLATAPATTATGLGATIEEVNTDPAGPPSGAYTRFVLRVTETGVILRQATTGYTVNDFLDLDTVGNQLALGVDPIVIWPVTTVTISTNGRAVIDTLLAFASPGVGPFLRGRANSGPSVDLSDAVFILGYLFLGTETPTCLAAADTNGSGDVDLADAVYLINFLFTGGPAPKAPYPELGFSQKDGDKLIGCATPQN